MNDIRKRNTTWHDFGIFFSVTFLPYLGLILIYQFSLVEETYKRRFSLGTNMLTLMLLVANLANTKWLEKPGNWLSPRHMGTHLRVLSESFPMNINMTVFKCSALWRAVYSPSPTERRFWTIHEENGTSSRFWVSMSSRYELNRWKRRIKPLTLKAAKTGLTILEILNLRKHFLKKHLKEKCWSGAEQQLSFKYFVHFCFIPELFSKV